MTTKIALHVGPVFIDDNQLQDEASYTGYERTEPDGPTGWVYFPMVTGGGGEYYTHASAGDESGNITGVMELSPPIFAQVNAVPVFDASSIL